MRQTEQTHTIISAVEQVDKIDLDKLFLSGIDITLHDYSNPDRDHVSRVTLAAEDCAPLLAELRKALLKSAERRRESLRQQFQDLNKLLTKDM